MIIDNFHVIEEFMNINNLKHYKEGPTVGNYSKKYNDSDYYKFEALIRNTDGENPLYAKGYSNSNKNILIKSWYIDSEDYYYKIKNEMKTLCELTGARLYMTLDKKSTKKTIVNLHRVFSNKVIDLAYGNNVSIKSTSREFASCTSIVDSSVHNARTIMFDVDIKDEGIKECICNYIYSNKQTPYVLETKKGYHVFCYKKFNTENWLHDAVSLKEGNIKESQLAYDLNNYVSVLDNQLGLVYIGDCYNE